MNFHRVLMLCRSLNNDFPTLFDLAPMFTNDFPTLFTCTQSLIDDFPIIRKLSRREPVRAEVPATQKFAVLQNLHL